ncbi:hypothetical protein GOODEAATRI_009395 [Goodea atripinnis]|uniref:Secreted protein n=1 Tax=Goodea atripinnis TaxID=208336 RepID=A0ABV0NT49_9TELE
MAACLLWWLGTLAVIVVFHHIPEQLPGSLNHVYVASEQQHSRHTLFLCHTRFKLSYQFVFESFAPDVELHSGGTRTRTGTTGAEVAATSSAASTVGAVVVLCPADLIDSDTAKSSAPQGKPPTAGVIPSHDHCSHTRITVTA